jgi:hypothetical protein
MFDRWASDWPKTPKWARITLVVLALVYFLTLTGFEFFIFGMRYDQSAFQVIRDLIIYLGGYVIWPYRLAWAVHRRGGHFDFWLVMSLLISGPLMGIFYLFRWSRKPLIAGPS